MGNNYLFKLIFSEPASLSWLNILKIRRAITLLHPFGHLSKLVMVCKSVAHLQCQAKNHLLGSLVSEHLQNIAENSKQATEPK